MPAALGRRAELSDSETFLTAANDLAVRRALEIGGVEFIDENGTGFLRQSDCTSLSKGVSVQRRISRSSAVTR